MLVNPTEVYLLARKSGSTNLMVWTASGTTTVRDLQVGADLQALQQQIVRLVPQVERLRIESLAGQLVVSGRVPDAFKVDRILRLCEAFAGGKPVVNLLQVQGLQQVMLEVKVSEVSRSLLEQLGVDFNLTRSVGTTTWSLLSQLLAPVGNTLGAVSGNGLSAITLSAEQRKGLIKVLAEPTITAINGQEGSFLAGGKVYIPVPQNGGTGAITLEEKEFGVGLRFLPTVMEEGLIELRVTPEVSELSPNGTTVRGPGGQSVVLPSINTRRASTTVQLRDGESFAIGGLIKRNVTESLRALPVLGELPILGALFRSTAFQNDQSELLFIVTPRLTRPLPPGAPLPTDGFVPPSRSELFLLGRMQGAPAAEAARPEDPARRGDEAAPGLQAPSSSPGSPARTQPQPQSLPAPAPEAPAPSVPAPAAPNVVVTPVPPQPAPVRAEAVVAPDTQAAPAAGQDAGAAPDPGFAPDADRPAVPQARLDATPAPAVRSAAQALREPPALLTRRLDPLPPPLPPPLTRPVFVAPSPEENPA